MKRRMSIILVAMLIMSMIPSFAFAVDLQDEADRLEKVFAKLTDEEKAYLSSAKAKIYDLAQDAENDVWDDVFEKVPVTNEAFKDVFGSPEEAEEFVRDFISEFTMIYFTGSDDLAKELEDFIKKHKEKFTDIFKSDGEDLLRDLHELMLGALDDPDEYIDYSDMLLLSNAKTTSDLIEEVKMLLKEAVSEKAEVKGNIKEQLASVGWEAGKIVEAVFILLEAADPDLDASLALANAFVRSNGELVSGNTKPKVGQETSYTVSFFEIETDYVKFALADSSEGEGSFSGDKFTPSKEGEATVYVYRRGVDPENEALNYIFKFDISIKSDDDDDGGGSGGGSPPEEKPPASDTVKEVGSDSIETEVKKVDGQNVAEVSVDDDAIKNVVEESEEGTTVVINVDADADVVQAGFGGDMISLMEKNDISISIKTETASYSVPAKDLNISALAKELGENVEVSDVQISIVIGQPTAEEIKVVEDQAVKAGVQLVIPPIEFNVVCTDGENSVKVSKFNRFVERSIKVPEGVDPKTITTAVVQDKKGNLTPVPTEVVKIDGAYYVRIKSMTNSVYTVINNIKKFADVANHWAKDDVNDMGSRLIINGVSDTTFEPDRDITRAEFMTIVVRALGIMRSGEGVDAFDDVKADDWYYDAVSIAKDYGLTNGNGDGTFAPNSKITREEAMAIIARAMKMAGMDTAVNASEISTVLSTFVDNGNVSEWAKESVSACVKNGIVGGYAGKISAKNNITRAECAAIVKRMLFKADLID